MDDKHEHRIAIRHNRISGILGTKKTQLEEGKRAKDKAIRLREELSSEQGSLECLWEGYISSRSFFASFSLSFFNQGM